MTGIWLVSYITLWVLVLAGVAALLALARELVALRRGLEMVQYQLAREREQTGGCRCGQSAEPGAPRAHEVQISA